MEISTKLASVIPYLLGMAYVLLFYKEIKALPAFVFAGGLIFFDMTATSINNTVDACHEKKKGFDPVSACGFPIPVCVFIVLILLSAAVFFGLWLYFLSGIPVLIVGVFCFITGIFYTFGPVPISRMPLGEVFSGFTMGFCIPLLFLLSQRTNIIGLDFYYGTLTIVIPVMVFIKFFIFTVPAMCCIANIMLANNICDMEKDPKTDRFTLPFYIGRKISLYLYGTLYLVSYIGVVVTVIIYRLPFYTLLPLLSIPFTAINIKGFFKKQDKGSTFKTSILNFLLINFSFICTLFIAGFTAV